MLKKRRGESVDDDGQFGRKQRVYPALYRHFCDRRGLWNPVTIGLSALAELLALPCTWVYSYME